MHFIERFIFKNKGRDHRVKSQNKGYQKENFNEPKTMSKRWSVSDKTKTEKLLLHAKSKIQ